MKTVTQVIYPILLKRVLINCYGSVVKQGLILLLMCVNYQPISKTQIKYLRKPSTKYLQTLRKPMLCEIPKARNESDLHIVIYSDGAHGNLTNGVSQDGYVILLCGRNRMCSPLN